MEEKQKKDELTPMMRQYLEIKKEHQDKVLFFRLGDFYEMFFEDAVEVSHLLNLTLTHRGPSPMCGIPYHAAKNYIKRLLELGKKIAICEQLELSDNPKEIAKREVIKVYTPATVIEDEYLDSQNSSYLLCIDIGKQGLGIAYADVTTGSFYIRRFDTKDMIQKIEDILYSVYPKEIILADDIYFQDRKLKGLLDSSGVFVTKLPSWYFSIKTARTLVELQFGPGALAMFNIDEKDLVLKPVGALLKYMQDMSHSELPQFRSIEWLSDERHLVLNAATIKSLELVSNIRDGKKDLTLFSTINRTLTSSGARYLKEELLNPLSDISLINERLDWIERFNNDKDELESVRKALSASSDLSRLAIKMSMEKTLPRDLAALSSTVSSVMDLIAGRKDYLALIASGEQIAFDKILEFSIDIEKGINPECTNIANEQTIIKDGYDSKLDEMRNLISNSSSVLNEYLEKVKSETGITILKAGENRIIGYYLEVPKGQLSRVPDYFIRRQTLVGGERFTTAELEDIQSKIYNAKEDAAKLEIGIYKRFVKKAKELYMDVENIGKIISKLDFFSSLSVLSQEKGYVRPKMIEEGEMEIIDGRHPVVEDQMDRNSYVENSFCSLDGRFALVTGPNMAGKSTYLREIALISILAHMGSFVPAKKAVIPIMDKLFCRVGASDNLARGESTFLVEMIESAQILRSASRRSLVIMDEIGRGTSTEDGMAIAYSIMQYLKTLGSITLFATHYHELTSFDTYGMQLLTLEVAEEKNSIVFLRKAVKGVATSSYGIHVAKLAGVPREIVKNAVAFQKRHFDDYSSSQQSLFTTDEKLPEEDGGEILEKIRDFDIENSSPLEALLFLSEIKKELD